MRFLQGSGAVVVHGVAGRFQPQGRRELLPPGLLLEMVAQRGAEDSIEPRQDEGLIAQVGEGEPGTAASLLDHVLGVGQAAEPPAREPQQAAKMWLHQDFEAGLRGTRKDVRLSQASPRRGVQPIPLTGRRHQPGHYSPGAGCAPVGHLAPAGSRFHHVRRAQDSARSPARHPPVLTAYIEDVVRGHETTRLLEVCPAGARSS